MKSFKTLILRCLGVIILFGFTLFLTNNFSPIIIGQYDFIRTFLLVIGSICLLGTDQSILYFSGIINCKGSILDLKNTYLKMVSSVFVMSIVILFLFLLIGKSNVIFFFNDPDIYFVLLKSVFILFFYCLTFLNTETFRALGYEYLAEFFRNIFKFVSVIFGAIILLKINQEQYLVDSFLIGFVLLSIISTFLILKFMNFKIKNNSTLKSVTFSKKEIVSKSFPMAIGGMCFFLIMTIDIMFIKKYHGSESVAFYSTAIKLMNIITMVILSINIGVSGEIAEHFENNNRIALQMLLKRSARLIFFISLPIVLLMCFFSNSILSIFGGQYKIASGALIVMMIGQGISAAFGAAPVYLNMTGRQKSFQFILIITVFLDLFLNFMLTPVYGILGTSIAFTISSLFWIITASIIIYKKDKINVFIV